MSSSQQYVSLIVAPLAEELRPLLRRSGSARLGALPGGALYRVASPVGMALAAVVGDGAEGCRSNIEHLISRFHPRRMLMLGIAGGLSPDLEVGELVQASTVVEPAASGAVKEWHRSKGVGTVVSVPHILTSGKQKAELWQRLGEPEKAVVDLESVVFARSAEKAGADWTVVRVVSDLQNEDLPLDLAAASDQSGHVVRARVLRQLLLRPGDWLGVNRLRKRLDRCADELASRGERWLEAEVD